MVFSAKISHIIENCNAVVRIVDNGTAFINALWLNFLQSVRHKFLLFQKVPLLIATVECMNKSVYFDDDSFMHPMITIP